LIAAMCALVTAVLQGLLGSLSVGSLALAATLGAAGGLLLVRGGACLVALVRYPLRRHRNRSYEARPGRVVGGRVAFDLVCTAPRPILDWVASLGYMEAEITDPTGASVRILSNNLDRLGSRVEATCPFSPCRGTYEVRWYASTEAEKLYEVTRTHSEITAAGPAP